ncbi:MAG: hypothetical protein CVU77_01830 [Elusimicrobia bacterium HGW-Elusimicrobia-1]|jgi:hypothetical protein|nr:MAG: hypothetical protein CVU77_01830 [Elusimicrobia bacterium HGW-Elusimicrobia-1]
MNYLFKTTNQLTDGEKKCVRDLHYEVFGKVFDPADFEKKYSLTAKGYSYHGLMIDGSGVVGFYAAVPYRYEFFGKEFIFALAVDGMIHPEYRKLDPLGYKKMTSPVYENLRANDIPFIFCFPNDSAYLYTKKVLGWRDIGALDFYLFPAGIAAKPADFLAGWLHRAASMFGVSKLRRVVRNAGIKKIADNIFMEHRYGTGYRTVNLPDGTEFIYRMCRELSRFDVAFIIDIRPADGKNIQGAVSSIIKNEKNAAAVAYIGKLGSPPPNLIKLPRSLEPKKIRMIGKLLGGALDDRIFDIDNWEVNLSNFDVR